MLLVRVLKKKRAGGPFFAISLFCIISKRMLSLHIITLFQGQVGGLRSNTNKMKR